MSELRNDRPENSPLGVLLLVSSVCLMGAGGAAALAVLWWKASPSAPAPQAPPVASFDREQQEQQRSAYTRLMIQGGTALAGHRPQEAVTAYREALKLFPDDRDAAKGLAEAEAAVTAQAKSQQAQEKQTEFARLLEQGRSAMSAKQFAQAVRAFDQALLLMPGEATAARGLAEAREALATDRNEKQKLDDYQNRMTAGRAALAAQQFVDALREFGAAQQLLPGDAAAQQGLLDAQKGLAAVQDQDKRRTEYSRLMDQAGAALRNQRYDESLRAYADALRVMPGDAAAQQGLRDAKTAQGNLQGEYARLMKQGEAAARSQQYGEAIRAYQDALKLLPGDGAATRALRGVEKAQADLLAVQAAQAMVTQQMNLGAAAMLNQQYAAAVQAYSDVLRLAPGDLAATLALQQARAALAQQEVRQLEYAKQMKVGYQAVKEQRFSDAIRAFTEALRLAPNDAAATLALRDARFLQHMANGQAAFKAKRYADAVRAFEEALKVIPDDRTATLALRQARAALKK